SMGGRPRWALVALACPQDVTVAEVEEFYAGMLELARAHDVAVVGGDTSASPRGWVVNVTLLGEAVRAPVLRSTAKPGDLVAVTGALGRAAAGLAVLERGAAPAGVAAGELDDVKTAHLRPTPRVSEGQWLAGAGEPLPLAHARRRSQVCGLHVVELAGGHAGGRRPALEHGETRGGAAEGAGHGDEVAGLRRGP